MKRSTYLNIFGGLVYLFLYLPIIVLVVYSFDNSRLAVNWTGFTLKWYQQLWSDEALISALKNSLIVATSAVFASAIMGTMAAVGLSRQHFAWKDLYRGFIILPIIIPEIAMAVAALILFVALGVKLGLATVIVSHIVFCVAYMILVVMGRLQGMNPNLEEAARDLGASPIMAFFKVTLPLLLPGIISGCLLTFVLSLDDFIITQFTAGVGATTLPLWIYSSVKFGVSPEINALSTIMIVATISTMLLAELVRHKKLDSTTR